MALGGEITTRSGVWRLVIANVLLLLSATGLVAFALFDGFERAGNGAEMAAGGLAEGLAKDISCYFGKIDQHLMRIKLEAEPLINIRVPDSGQIETVIARELEIFPEIDAIRIADESGFIRYGSIRPIGDATNLSDRAYFSTLKEDPKAGLVIFGPTQSRIGRHWVLLFARRLDRPDGSFAGVVYARIRLESLDAILSLANARFHGSLSLRWANDWRLVVRNPQVLGGTNSREVSDAFQAAYMKNPDQGMYMATSKLDNDYRLFRYKAINSYNMVVIAGVNRDDYLSSWRRNRYFFVVMYLFFVFSQAFVINHLRTGGWFATADADRAKQRPDNDG